MEDLEPAQRSIPWFSYYAFSACFSGCLDPFMALCPEGGAEDSELVDDLSVDEDGAVGVEDGVSVLGWVDQFHEDVGAVVVG